MTRRDPKQTLRRRDGFTLLEILVVVAIIAALAAVGVVYLLPAGEDAKIKICNTEIKTIEQALQLYYKDHLDNWPQNLNQLMVKDEYGGPYMKGDLGSNGQYSALTDEWGQAYQYEPGAVDSQGVSRPRIYSVSPQAKNKVFNF